MISSAALAPAAASSAVLALDAINIGLMLAAAAVACFVPVELFMFAYIVLGPLHYLTQLAWLRDRRWFMPRRVDAWLLAVPATLLVLGMPAHPQLVGDWRAPLAIGSLVAAAVLVLSANWLSRLVLLAVGCACVWLLRFDTHLLLLALMLPTAIHIFVFTGGFMLNGALRHRSWVGGLAFGLFITIPIVLLAMPIGDPNYVPSPLFAKAAEAFGPIRERLGVLFRVQPDSLVRVDRFLGWAYSYHYLNWFSKTRLIGWHHGTRRRLGAIALAWLLCVGLYLIDYQLGFLLVGVVGMLHVVLEFPLDVRTFAGLPTLMARSVRG